MNHQCAEYFGGLEESDRPRVEDDHGFITDQPLDRWDADAVSEISREEFQRVRDS